MLKHKAQAFVTFDSRFDLLAKHPSAVLARYVTFSNGWNGEMWDIGNDQQATCPDSDDPRWKEVK